MKIISFGGQLINGKTICANRLRERLNELTDEEWNKNSFAAKVKQTYMDNFKVDAEFIEKWKRIEEAPPGFDMPVRESLMFIGDGFRNIRPNVWIDLAFEGREDNQVIDDVRYISEAVRIQEEKGISILMWRKGYENSIDNRSEKELFLFVEECLLKDKDGKIDEEHIPFDIFLRNDKGVKELYEKIDEMVVPYVRERFNV